MIFQRLFQNAFYKEIIQFYRYWQLIFNQNLEMPDLLEKNSINRKSVKKNTNDQLVLNIYYF